MTWLNNHISSTSKDEHCQLTNISYKLSSLPCIWSCQTGTVHFAYIQQTTSVVFNDPTSSPSLSLYLSLSHLKSFVWQRASLRCKSSRFHNENDLADLGCLCQVDIAMSSSSESTWKSIRNFGHETWLKAVYNQHTDFLGRYLDHPRPIQLSPRSSFPSRP